MIDIFFIWALLFETVEGKVTVVADEGSGNFFRSFFEEGDSARCTEIFQKGNCGGNEIILLLLKNGSGNGEKRFFRKVLGFS